MKRLILLFAITLLAVGPSRAADDTAAPAPRVSLGTLDFHAGKQMCLMTVSLHADLANIDDYHRLGLAHKCARGRFADALAEMGIDAMASADLVRNGTSVELVAPWERDVDAAMKALSAETGSLTGGEAK